MDFEKPFSIRPLRIVDYGKPWDVDIEFKAWELLAVLYAEPRPGDKFISFTEAYKGRFMEFAQVDEQGKYWLVSSKAIRKPLHQWAKEKGLFIFFNEDEICFPHPPKLPKS